MRILDKIIRYCNGYVKAKSIGGRFADFLNDALKAGLGISEVMQEDGSATFTIPTAQYKLIRKPSRKNQCRIRITSKHGLPVRLRHIKFPTAKIAGIAVFLAVIYLLGKTAFVIEIAGTGVMSRQRVLDTLYPYGLYVGCIRSSLDIKQLENEMLINNASLSWATINSSFGVVRIELKSKTDEPHDDKMLRDTRLVSDSDAQITRIEVTGGTATVTIGQVVKAGDELAVPVEFGKKTQTSWETGLRAKVYGKIHIKETVHIKKRHIVRSETGEFAQKKAIEIFKAVLPLPFITPKYEYSDVLEYKKPIYIFNTRLPMNIVYTRISKIKQYAVQLNMNDAERILHDRMEQQKKEKFGENEILSSDIACEETNEEFIFSVDYIMERQIGTYVAN
ncbi:MAG: sporulation protein YqfD [Oscillospiraceae bacterium]